MSRRSSSAFEGDDQQRPAKRNKSIQPSAYNPFSSSALRSSPTPPTLPGQAAGAGTGTSSTARSSAPSFGPRKSRNIPEVISLEDDEIDIAPFRRPTPSEAVRVKNEYSPKRKGSTSQARGQVKHERSTSSASLTPRGSRRSQSSTDTRSLEGSEDTPISLEDFDDDDLATRMARSPSAPSEGLFVSREGTPVDQDASNGDGRSASSTPASQAATPTETAVVLTAEQQEVVNAALRGRRNIFYTGAAGSGKSTVLIAIRTGLCAKGKRVEVVAPTGRAALDVGGTTTWSFVGWQPDSVKLPIQELERLAETRFVRQRMREIDVLIIDEISMVENHFFGRLDRVMKAARDDDGPFGGVQLIVTGDFCQLPPVEPFQHCFQCGYELLPKLDSTQYVCGTHGTFFDTDKWAFRSDAWEDANFLCFHLKTIHRQEDGSFQSILQKIRFGNTLTEDERFLLLNHQYDVRNATRLFATRSEVRSINNSEFDKLRARPVTYHCLDHWKHNREHTHLKYKGLRHNDGTLKALKDHQYEPIVHFKVGMRVILMVNIDIGKGLVNGSQGEIVAFLKHREEKLPKASNRPDSSVRMSDDKQERNATAGVQSLGGKYALLQYAQVKQFIADDKNHDKVWPIVKFDKVKKPIAVYANCRVRALGDDEPYSLIARTQIPLAPAWAMTIHKSQGMTLNKVTVDVSRTFEQGQDYVALSRARNLEGLKIEGAGAGWTGKGCNEEVKNFLREKFPELDIE
ncbi:ATP-dependent DNA helicase pif1 [Pseudocercospora fuligena]|uniref:ATP-dependent DNA helicase n=1 Tax=Pseudocercospora fuligena TaxID=685502 RepID=A0A8H6RLQ7_9PEZI|nr:ATP-dependent DNA helicase pif1 [Pseudocercospora fuligena]